MKRRAIAPTGLAYAQAHEVEGVSRWLFVSGQVPETDDGHAPDAFADQCRLAWANLQHQLAAAGMGFDNLVKVTVFLADRAYRAENSAIRREILGDRSPALTIIITGIYEEKWLLEIEAVAAA